MNEYSYLHEAQIYNDRLVYRTFFDRATQSKTVIDYLEPS